MIFESNIIVSRFVCDFSGMRPESANLKSASRCVTCCVDSINENMETHFDNRVEISRNSEGTPHICSKNECGFMRNDRECTQSFMHLNSEQKEFTVIENGKECELDNGTGSVKESVVLVEKEGFATVVMYPERHAAHVFLADGTVMTGNNQGEYEVCFYSKYCIIVLMMFCCNTKRLSVVVTSRWHLSKA